MRTSQKIRIGMAQLLVEGGQLTTNIARAIQMIRDAAAQGCEIVVLPECFDLGWMDTSARTMAKPIPGFVTKELINAAKKQNIAIVTGITELAGQKRYNTAILISSQGEIHLKHRKINVLHIAQDLYSIGDRLGVAQLHTKSGKIMIGIPICADNFPSSLVFSHSLCRMGANLLLSPCAWAVDEDHDNDESPTFLTQ